MPLPDGWTSTVETYELNRDRVPPCVRVGIRFSGPDNSSFALEQDVPIDHLSGFTPRQVVQRLVWPDMRGYVSAVIADRYKVTSAGDPPAAIVGQIVALP